MSKDGIVDWGSLALGLVAGLFIGAIFGVIVVANTGGYEAFNKPVLDEVCQELAQDEGYMFKDNNIGVENKLLCVPKVSKKVEILDEGMILIERE